MSDSELNRRKFVAATGTAGALVLAGCADSGPGGGDNETENGEETNETGNGNETEDTGSGDETYSLTVTVEDDQEEPVEGATVTLEQADSGMLGGNGEENESNESNESDDGMMGGNGEENESDNDSEESEVGSFIQEDNESNESDGGMMGGNGEENESDNESGNETEDGGLGTSEEWPREEETDENGEVEFDELEDGEYTVTAEHEGEEAEDDVEIDGGDEEVTLTLGEGGSSGNESGNETDDGMMGGNGEENESDNDSDNESDDS